MIRGVVRERGFSIREIAASIIYEKVYSEVARKFEEKTNGLVTRAAIFFSKHCRHQLKDYVASSVAEVAANLTPKRIFLGSVTSIIGGIFGLITYSIFFNSMISPYIF